MSETESTSEIDYTSDDSESSTESEIEEVQHNVKTSSKSIKDEEPSDAMVNELLAKYSPNEVYNIIKGSMSNSEKKKHKSHHHVRSISRSRSRSTHRRSKGRKHSKESLDEPPKSKRGRKSSSKKDNDVPPPSRMTKAELQIELKKTREMIKKMQNKLEKSANPKKERKPKKDLEIDDEDIKEIIEETKPLGNDIVGREIQGEPIEPVYLK